MRAVTHFSRRNLLRQVSESGLGLPNYNSRPRYIRILARVEHPGIVSQGHTKATGHPCISDLTAAEVLILSKGGTVIKSDVLVGTHSQSTDGKINVFLTFKDLSGHEVGCFAINELTRCKIGPWYGNKNLETINAMIYAQTLASNDPSGKVVP